MTARVSFIVPTYNRADLLPAAITSLLAQTPADIEVIVVDDGSTDNTTAVVQPLLADNRLQYLRQSNRGRSATRNHGARAAGGEFLGFLDSDDLQLPGALEAHRRVLAQNPQLALTIGGYEYIDEAGRPLGQRLPWTESKLLSTREWIFNCFGVHGAFLVRRDWFNRIQGYDTDLHMAEDWDLFLRLAGAGCPMGWTPAVVCQYRQHPGSSIHSLALHRDSSLRALGKFFQQAGQSPELAGLASRAQAWVYVDFARRGFAAGHAESAAQDLQQALDLDPVLASERRSLLLESLFNPVAIGQQAAFDMEAAVLPYLPTALTRHSAEIRQAQARAHMAAFFRARGQQAPEQAQAHLRAALRRDARWLFNRGVLTFCVRQAFQHSAQAGSA